MSAEEKRPFAATFTLVLLAIFGVIVAGAVYERVERRNDRARFPQIGRSIDLGGRRINLYCSGEGEPAVVFESATPMPGYSWAFIQRAVANVTRACWYDRAGYGWSDPAPNPRDGAAIASDLHKTLRAAGERPPYVLVGALFGGLYARTFHKLYPRDVAGLVLVDPLGAEEVTDPKRKGLMPNFLHYPQSLVAQALNQVGLVRLFGIGSPPGPRNVKPQGLTAAEWTTITGLRQEPKARVALLQELAADFAAEDHDAGELGNLPLIVLGSESWENHSDRLSTRGKLIVVANGDARIQFNAPQAVIGATRDVVADVRR